MAWFHDHLDHHPSSEQLEGYLVVEEAAQEMGVSEQRVRQLAKQRVLQSARWDGVLFVRLAITNYT